jgi:predicted RNase H-like HicB family nuclease
MTQIHQLTALLERETDGYVSVYPELDIASQGDTVEEARRILEEAVQLFFETASENEIQSRMRSDIYVTRLWLERLRCDRNLALRQRSAYPPHR